MIVIDRVRSLARVLRKFVKIDCPIAGAYSTVVWKKREKGEEDEEEEEEGEEKGKEQRGSVACYVVRCVKTN